MAAAVLAGVLGLTIGAVSAVSAVSVRGSDRSQRRLQPPDPSALPAGVSDVLAVLRSGAIVLDAADAVVSTSPPAVAHGL
ncbi:MAG TPA: two-component sensor histidine kinase, partial [Dermatophilaceae bacterium]|nr:two-component sensor histidine kinase [Dermatophilaceae bacterium]